MNPISVMLRLPFLVLLFGCGCSGAEPASTQPVTFRVTLANVSAPLETPDGELPASFAPGAWAVHDADEPIFTSGAADRAAGLESLAEDGDPSKLAASLRKRDSVATTDTFDLPDSEYAAGVVRPGASFMFEITAIPGQRLSFAGMYAQSNDVFLATPPEGMALFDTAGEPRSGDVTADLQLWDTGSEVNQEPGIGADQAPRQAAPNTGQDERGLVRRLDDGFSYADPFVTATLEAL